ncbi:YxeA family protein [Treponema phagedenis]|uniref:YxeA family protein n=1 Tax=Treponema phagedenis TaxID=162 RepID=A0A0B7GUS8_TREPH|nr:YxeA family protein [Treponema phagedenis]NVP24190.1 YxeA family protein [Treponema phagedenis]NVP25709.1 YxeA family protein [Treponema phagedenis]QEJ94162.1 YxeA family protein [Treponema phagedenis]QEJ99251.1 YxeA family protein [Treponema phagedenis]QEK04818.1 YxeA family protein [Treponema phagedenis]
MIKKLLIVICAIIVVIIGVCIFYILETDSTYYYSQIDNRKIEKVKSSGGVINFSVRKGYSYILFSYDKNGKGKDIKFGASRELKEGAFIRLTVVPIRGVIAWEEVQYEELPAAVREKVVCGRTS